MCLNFFPVEFRISKRHAHLHLPIFVLKFKQFCLGGKFRRKNFVDFPFRDKIDGPNEEERKRKEENNEIIASAPGSTLRVSEKEKKKEVV
jgi:hypothetical protein